MKELDEMQQVIKAASAKVSEEDAFNAGRDAGLNGVNTTNCHFKYFGSAALTAAWEQGKRAASNG